MKITEFIVSVLERAGKDGVSFRNLAKKMEISSNAEKEVLLEVLSNLEKEKVGIDSF